MEKVGNTLSDVILIIIRKSTCQIKIVGGYLYQFPTADVTNSKRGDKIATLLYLRVRGSKTKMCKPWSLWRH